MLHCIVALWLELHRSSSSLTSVPLAAFDDWKRSLSAVPLYSVQPKGFEIATNKSCGNETNVIRNIMLNSSKQIFSVSNSRSEPIVAGNPHGPSSSPHRFSSYVGQLYVWTFQLTFELPHLPSSGVVIQLAEPLDSILRQ